MKHLLLLAAVVLWTGLGFLIKRWPQNISKTFSQHAAAQRESILYYAVLFSIVLPLMALYVVNWLIPTFNLSWTFTVFIWLAIVTQFVVVLIPETKGWRYFTHRFLAFWGAFFLLPTLYFLAANQGVSIAGRYASGVSLVIMTGIFATLVASKAEHQYFLILQGSFFALYFISLLTVTYT